MGIERGFDAITTLDNMKKIVERGLIHGHYMEQVDDITAICKGRRACAVGALYLGNGVTPYRSDSGYIDLPGVSVSSRGWFMDERPGLKTAYDALNNAAQEKVPETIPEDIDDSYFTHLDESGTPKNGYLEAFFESGLADGDQIGIKLLEVIDRAKQIINETTLQGVI